MEQFIINMMNQYGYLGIFLLILIENIFPPIPSEVILTFAGFMTVTTNLNIWIVVLISTTGSIIGALILYYLGKLLSPERLEKFLNSKLGKLLFLKKEDIEKAYKWFNSKGKSTVLFCRWIPIVRSLISIPAGMSNMKMSSFLVMTTIGTAIWNLLLIGLGAIVGESWRNIVAGIDIYSNIILIGIIGLLIVIVGILYLKNKKLKKKK